MAFGDSITHGATSTIDANASWPSGLAARLLANPATANLAIVNQGTPVPGFARRHGNQRSGSILTATLSRSRLSSGR